MGPAGRVSQSYCFCSDREALPAPGYSQMFTKNPPIGGGGQGGAPSGRKPTTESHIMDTLWGRGFCGEQKTHFYLDLPNWGASGGEGHTCSPPRQPASEHTLDARAHRCGLPVLEGRCAETSEGPIVRWLCPNTWPQESAGRRRATPGTGIQGVRAPSLLFRPADPPSLSRKPTLYAHRPPTRPPP